MCERTGQRARNITRHATRALISATVLWALVAAASAADPAQLSGTVAKGVAFLHQAQAPDGSFTGQRGIGVTALATFALLCNGASPEEPHVAKGLSSIVASVQETGGIHKPGTFIPNYETCIAICCLQAANADGRYAKIIQGGEKFIRSGQYDETNHKERADLYYGGVGYGGSTRPDLSNTSFFLDALKACGAGPKDEAMQKALVFVSRCQNLESEHNTLPAAAKVNDGGFYYTGVVEKQDSRRQGPEGGLRSYGSMTYSGLKSLLYAGVSKDDPRVKAAVTWISKHYDLTSNPGMGDAGLYYYYHTFAKALDAIGQPVLVDGQGAKHDWRSELTAELARRQQSDGSWINSNTQWGEGDPNLATAFALLSLSYCRVAAAP